MANPPRITGWWRAKLRSAQDRRNRPLALRGRAALGRQEGHGDQGGAERQDVDGVGGRQTEMRDHHPADCRPGDEPRVEEHDVERQRSGEPVVADQVRDDRRARRGVDGAEQRRDRDHRIDPEERRVAHERTESEQSRAAPEADLGHEQDAASIESVGDRATGE